MRSVSPRPSTTPVAEAYRQTVEKARSELSGGMLETVLSTELDKAPAHVIRALYEGTRDKELRHALGNLLVDRKVGWVDSHGGYHLSAPKSASRATTSSTSPTCPSQATSSSTPPTLPDGIDFLGRS